MNAAGYLRDAALQNKTRVLPLLTFPAVQLMDVRVDDMVRSAQLQARAMKLVVDETDALAAVSPMDLSIEAEAFGAQVRFSADEVPAVTGRVVEDEEGAAALQVPSMDCGRAQVCAQTIRLAREMITDRPVFAGMIGPFSLAGRLMDVTEIMYACYDEPEMVEMVLDKTVQYLIAYGSLLRDSGAHGVVMAEPLAGIMSPEMMRRFSAPYVKRIISALQTDRFAVIYHNCGNAIAAMAEDIFAQGAAAYHFGNAVPLKQMISHAPDGAIVMGNIDPVGEFARGSEQSMREAVRTMLEECGSYPGFILSSGCDIPASAPWENIRAFVRAAKEYGA